jgi:hypothetical protein
LTACAFIQVAEARFDHQPILDMPLFKQIELPIVHKIDDEALACVNKLRFVNLADSEILKILGAGKAFEQVENAIAYLHSKTDATQYELVVPWEGFAREIARNRFAADDDPRWDCTRFESNFDKSVGYLGEYSHAIVFRPDGSIYKGKLSDDDFTQGNRWLGTGDLKRIK